MSNEYPKAKYRLDKQGELESTTVADSAAEKALGKGWADTPAALGVETAPSLEDRERRIREGKRPDRFDQAARKTASTTARKTARKRK